MSTKEMNEQVVLIARPNGMPELSDFALKEVDIPTPREGEVLLKTLYLSVDPYMRGRMNDGPSYVPPFALNEPPTGGGIAQVIASKSPKFKGGEIVTGQLSWSTYSVVNGADLQILHPEIQPMTAALGVLGMPGLTAYFGLQDLGKPKAGETIVVSSAAGAVGSVVGQIAKINGYRVVGMAGSQEKIHYMTKELKFDGVINYKNENLAEALKKSCPRGVDLYFDNVGGEIAHTVFRFLNLYARVVVCGQISKYNGEQDICPSPFMTILTKRLTVKGMMVFDYQDRYPEAIQQMMSWIREGKLKSRETIMEGIQNLPKALIHLFKGENIGKQIVKVSADV